MEEIKIDEQANARTQEKNSKLLELRKRIDEKKDAMDLGIDDGIKDGVVIFNAFGLRTSQSCEGHFGQDREGTKRLSGPWIEVSADEPGVEAWFDDEELREAVIKERNELMVRAIKLLQEFYVNRPTSFDVRLGFERVGYRFRIQNTGTEVFDELTNGLSEEEKTKKFRDYKREMDDFVAFLKSKYLNG